MAENTDQTQRQTLDYSRQSGGGASLWEATVINVLSVAAALFIVRMSWHAVHHSGAENLAALGLVSAGPLVLLCQIALLVPFTAVLLAKAWDHPSRALKLLNWTALLLAPVTSIIALVAGLAEVVPRG